jgi:Ca2+/H+ antiporter
MLGLAALIPMIVVAWQVIRKWLRRKTLFKGTEYRLIIIASGAYLLSLIGSALTAEGQPHSLRSCGAWIFAAIVIVIGWLLIARSKKRWLISLAIVVAIISILAYAVDLSAFFPIRAHDAYLG